MEKRLNGSCCVNLSSTPSTHQKLTMAVYLCKPRRGDIGLGGSLGLGDSWFCQIGELWVQEETLFQEIRWRMTKQDP